MPDVITEIKEKHQTVQTAVLMAMAAECGRAGKLSEAESILYDLLKAGVESAEVYDLLARVSAQIGRYDRAVEMWQKAINIDPTNVSFKRALKRASITRQRKRPIRVIIVLFSIATLSGGVLLHYHFHRNYMPVGAMGMRAPNQQPMQNISGVAVTKPEGLDSIMIDMPHLTKTIKSNKIILFFDEGLFASGERLKPEARSLLLQLAHQLQKYSNVIDVAVVGITDNLPVRENGQYKDNYALGIARAVSVTECLRSTTALPDGLFTIRTVGGGDAPYPNDSLINRLKNRTATFVITEKKENN